ncbi:cysteine-rich protein 2-binding protein [Phymastichus coffea]|uniref:cysteine-rich protein 2-binding protein n=1 Tax=Phymastichus coffea TaxID=108790 RepID=UPI00273C0BE2|nr:cysteine-rich protein 2-binding protein [Phymastichus coffea]
MTSVSNLCKVCSNKADEYHNPALRCQGKCQQIIHIKCLKRGTLPTTLLGDVFFDLHCTECSDSHEEVLVRQKMSWLAAIILVMYNIRAKSNGLSFREYFHWRSDLTFFIDTNWDLLFTKSVKKKKNWIGTISGTLSHYTGVFFQSGTAELEQQGWWKLIDKEPPEVLMKRYYKMLELKKQQAKTKNKNMNISNLNIENENNSSIDYFSQKVKTVFNNESTSNTLKPCVSQPTSTEEDLEDDLDLDITCPEDDIVPFNLTSNSGVDTLSFKVCDEILDTCINHFPMDTTMKVEEGNISSEEIDIFNEPFPENNKENILKQNIYQKSTNFGDNYESSKSYDLPSPKPSLFNLSVSRPWPWDESLKFNPEQVKPIMSEREEEYLLQKIDQYKDLLDSAPSSVRRLYRKLVVRKRKRQYGLPILNVDTLRKDQKQRVLFQKKGNDVLDRFISEDISIFFEQRLQGYCEATSVHSPYTNRLLKPFIRRDTSSCPLWLRVTNELLTKVNSKNPEWKLPALAPIDYSYIRPQHIPAINSLCTQFFWPGVDLTECLQYPDFTCIVLYKKLVVAFAIMVPDVGFNEAYISFFFVRPEWRKAGIGTFMLYHLIQTCMGKDITLHVSATNPALILYQKFGFKQEEFIQDFYDKYILPSSKESKHALFLRLSR